MDKVIEDGHVAVLYSRGFGAGWYSWHGVVPLLFDPIVVEMVRTKVSDETIEEYCIAKYGPDHYYGGAEDLTIDWLPVGTEFIIHEYDGNERIECKKDMDWITA